MKGFFLCLLLTPSVLSQEIKFLHAKIQDPIDQTFVFSRPQNLQQIATNYDQMRKNIEQYDPDLIYLESYPSSETT